jgi:two-component system chemotaxis response regulator CheY
LPNKILILDDSAGLHHIYKIILVRYKCPILTALNGHEGLIALAQNPDVNILIVDMHMQPRMNGLAFIKKVKEQEAFKDIPIIAVFSKGQEKDWQEAIQLAEGYLVKPFTSTEIHAVIENIISESVLEPQTS